MHILSGLISDATLDFFSLKDSPSVYVVPMYNSDCVFGVLDLSQTLL